MRIRIDLSVNTLSQGHAFLRAERLSDRVELRKADARGPGGLTDTAWNSLRNGV